MNIPAHVPAVAPDEVYPSASKEAVPDRMTAEKGGDTVTDK